MNDVFGPLILALFGLGIIVVLLFGMPQYCVWQQGLSGEATLRKAEQTRQILIEQARAEKESATLRSEAIEIIGQAAKEYPEYRYQEFLGAHAEALTNCNVELIYVPTESNIPITEAGKTAK